MSRLITVDNIKIVISTRTLPDNRLTPRNPTIYIVRTQIRTNGNQFERSNDDDEQCFTLETDPYALFDPGTDPVSPGTDSGSDGCAKDF